MNNTVMIEQKVEEDFTAEDYDIFLTPVFQFALLTGKLGNKSSREVNKAKLSEYCEEFAKHFPELVGTRLELVFKGFAIGFTQATDVWVRLMGLDEESSDATATTETAK